MTASPETISRPSTVLKPAGTAASGFGKTRRRDRWWIAPSLQGTVFTICATYLFVSGILLTPLNRTRRFQVTQVCFQNAAALGGTINDVRSLQGIAGQVVQLWQRKIDELLTPDDDAGQRRPAAVQRGG